MNYEPAIFDFNGFVNYKKYVENLTRGKIFSFNYWKKQEFINYKTLRLPVPVNKFKYLYKLYGNTWKERLNYYKNR